MSFCDERSIVGELAVRRVGEPGRHLPALDLGLHRSRPRPRVTEGDERHRRHLTGPMARLTVLLEDWEDVLAEGDRVVGGGRLAMTRSDGHDSDETGGETIADHVDSPAYLRVP